MKTILILGAIESFCDLIEDTKKMGIKTIVCDYYPDSAGKTIGDICYNISTTDIDSVTEIAKKHCIDGILCAFSDRNIPTCYEVAKKLGLPTYYSPEIIDLITNKIKMKNHLKKHAFPILNYKIIRKNFTIDDLKGLIFPVIIKPVDSSGSKGVILCNNIADVRNKFQECVSMGTDNKTDIIVEEFYKADEISITAWVKDGQAYVTCLYDVGKNYSQHMASSCVVFPSKYTDMGLDVIEELVQNLTDTFQVKEGPITVQCLIGDRGLKVNEYIYRLAGGSPYKFTEFLGGPNLAKMLVDYSVGNQIDYQNLESFTSRNKKTVYLYRIYATKSGKIFYDFTEDSIKEKIPECCYFHAYSPSGSSFSTVPTEGKVIARIFCEVTDPKKQSFNSFFKRLREVAVIYDEYGNNITSYVEPEKEITTECYNLEPSN